MSRDFGSQRPPTTDEVAVILIDASWRCTFANAPAMAWAGRFGLDGLETGERDLRPALARVADGRLLEQLQETLQDGASRQRRYEHPALPPPFEVEAHAANGGLIAIVRPAGGREDGGGDDVEATQFRLFVSQVREYAIFSTDAASTLTSWNRGVQQVLGYAEPEFVGRPAEMLFTPEDRAAGVPAREMADASASGQAMNDRWMLRGSGERFWASGMTTAVRDEAGRLLGFTKVLRDLTDRKLAEEALRTSEERLQLATSAARLGIWDFDVERQQLALDAECRRILGLNPHHPYALDDFFEAVDPAHRVAVRAAASQALAPGRGRIDLEAPLGGQDRWVRVIGRAYFGAQRAIRFIGCLQDVSALRLAQRERDELLDRERSARDSAERANRLKDEFLGTLSHELRTPLNAIVGYTRLLSGGDLPTDRQAHAIAVIDRNAQAQRRLIEEILDLSRIVGGVMRIQSVPVDLASVVDHAIDVVWPAATAKQIRLQRTVPEHPVIVLGDEVRLQQIVWNLLSNAVKFTPPHGRVSIELEAGERGSRLTVRDTGIGIPPEFLPHVFERFRQADARPSREYGGVGLGLAIVKHMVELHGGQVSVTSAGQGAGAAFLVELPPLPAVAEAVAPAPSPPATAGVREGALRGVRVLVVDDDPDAVELTRTFLERHGAQATVVTAGDRALRELDRLHPHLLVSDIAMPVMDGIELLRTIRQRGDAVPAIATTAYAAPVDRDRILGAGYNDYLAKPLDERLLVDAVARVLSLNQPGA